MPGQQFDQAIFDKRSPVAAWQIAQVTFTTQGADLVIPHTLETPDPEQINYEVLRISGPAHIYHDGSPTRRRWGKGFIVLRADAVPVQADILLTIAAGPIQTRPIPTSSTTPAAGNANTLDGLDSTDFVRSNESLVVVSLSSGLTNERRLVAGSGVTLTDGGANGDLTIAATGSASAPVGEAFLTIGNTGNLSAERAIAVGVGLTATDGGANGSYTVNLDRSFARKSADETVTSSAVLQDDDHLTVAIAASQTWRYRFSVIYDADAAGDLRFAFNVPASATGAFSFLGPDPTTATNLASGASADLTDTGVQQVGGGGAGTLKALHIDLLVVNGANSGNVKLRWAQGTSSGTGTIVKTNSFVVGERVA